MPITYKNGKHHRNPSGCHNKVKWFLSQSKWDIPMFTKFTNDFLEKELLGHKTTPVSQYWIFGWLDAISIARWILDGNPTNLPCYTFEKYPWASKYRPIPENWPYCSEEYTVK